MKSWPSVFRDIRAQKESEPGLKHRVQTGFFYAFFDKIRDDRKMPVKKSRRFPQTSKECGHRDGQHLFFPCAAYGAAVSETEVCPSAVASAAFATVRLTAAAAKSMHTATRILITFVFITSTSPQIQPLYHTKKWRKNQEM